MKLLKAFFIVFSLVWVTSAMAQKPTQVAISAQYLFTYYAENLFGAGYSYQECAHNLGLELSVGKYFGMGVSQLFIPVRSEVTGKHSYSGFGGFVKGRYSIEQYPQFEVYLLLGSYLSDYCLTEGPFYFPCNRGERVFIGGGLGLDWNFRGKWVLSGRLSDYLVTSNGDDDLINFIQLGLKRHLFLRVDKDR